MSRFAALAFALAAIGAPDKGRAAATTPSIQIQVVEPGGFHWQDAAVGSLAAIGFALVVGGLILATRSTRT